MLTVCRSRAPRGLARSLHMHHLALARCFGEAEPLTCPLPSPFSLSLSSLPRSLPAPWPSRARCRCCWRFSPSPPPLQYVAKLLQSPPQATLCPPAASPAIAVAGAGRQSPPSSDRRQQPLVSMARPLRATSGRAEGTIGCARDRTCSTTNPPPPTSLLRPSVANSRASPAVICDQGPWAQI